MAAMMPLSSLAVTSAWRRRASMMTRPPLPALNEDSLLTPDYAFEDRRLVERAPALAHLCFVCFDIDDEDDEEDSDDDDAFWSPREQSLADFLAPEDAAEDAATDGASLADALETELALADDAPIDTVTEAVAPVDLQADSNNTTDDVVTSVTGHHVPRMAFDDSVTAVMLKDNEPAVEMDDDSVPTTDSDTEAASSAVHERECVSDSCGSLYASLSTSTASLFVTSSFSSRRRTRGKRYARANVKINVGSRRSIQWRPRRLPLQLSDTPPAFVSTALPLRDDVDSECDDDVDVDAASSTLLSDECYWKLDELDQDEPHHGDAASYYGYADDVKEESEEQDAFKDGAAVVIALRSQSRSRTIYAVEPVNHAEEEGNDIDLHFDVKTVYDTSDYVVVEDAAIDGALSAEALETELALADEVPTTTAIHDVATVALPADSSDTTDEAMAGVTGHDFPPVTSNDTVAAVSLGNDERTAEVDDESVRTTVGSTASSATSEPHVTESMDGITTSLSTALSRLTTSSAASSRRRSRGKRYANVTVKVNARNRRRFQWRRRRNPDGTKTANDDQQNRLRVQLRAGVDTQVVSLNDTARPRVSRLPPLTTRLTPVVDDDTIPPAKAKNAPPVVHPLNPMTVEHPPQSRTTSSSSLDDETLEKANAKLRFPRFKKAQPMAAAVHDREDKGNGPSFLSVLSAALSSTPLFI